MTKIHSHYDVLGVQRTAPAEIIKGAYRKLCSKFHPDRNPGQDATAKMQEINAAYAVLSDPGKKVEYDARLVSDDMISFDVDRWMDEFAKRWESKVAEWETRFAQKPPVSPTASSHSSAAADAADAADAANDFDGFDAQPKRKPKAKPEKATEPTAEQQQAKQQQAKLEALRVEVRRMCSIPPAFILGDAGVLAVRAWKKAAAKWHPVVSSEWVSIEVLTAARKAMLQAAKVRAN